MRALHGVEAFRDVMNTLEDAEAQWRAVSTFFDTLAETHPLLPRAVAGVSAAVAANDDQATLSA